MSSLLLWHIIVVPASACQGSSLVSGQPSPTEWLRWGLTVTQARRTRCKRMRTGRGRSSTSLGKLSRPGSSGCPVRALTGLHLHPPLSHCVFHTCRRWAKFELQKEGRIATEAEISRWISENKGAHDVHTASSLVAYSPHDQVSCRRTSRKRSAIRITCSLPPSSQALCLPPPPPPLPPRPLHLRNLLS